VTSALESLESLLESLSSYEPLYASEVTTLRRYTNLFITKFNKTVTSSEKKKTKKKNVAGYLYSRFRFSARLKIVADG